MKNIFIPSNVPSPASIFFHSIFFLLKSKKEREEGKSINLLGDLLFRSSISRLCLVTDDFRPLRLNKTKEDRNESSRGGDGRARRMRRILATNGDQS